MMIWCRSKFRLRVQFGCKRLLTFSKNNADVFGLGLPSDNNFQPITSFVSLALLGNKIMVGVTLLGYGRKQVTYYFRELLPEEQNKYN